MSDRPAGLLTDSQREKLEAGLQSVDHSRQYRQRIRSRVRNGIHDLALLFKHLDNDDIDQAFSPDRTAIENALEVVENSLDRFDRAEIPPRQLHYTVSELSGELDYYKETEAEISDLEDELGGLEDEKSDEEGVFGEPTGRRRRELREKLHEKERSIDGICDNIRELLSDVREMVVIYQDTSAFVLEYLNEIDQLELPEGLAKDLDQIYELFKLMNRQLNECEGLLEGVAISEADQRDLIYMTEEIVDIFRRSEKTPSIAARGGRLRGDFRQLRRRLTEFQDALKRELERPEFAADLRDDYVKAIAFLFRISETLGTDTEEFTEEALIELYEEEYPDDVVGDVNVSIEAEPREEAVERAREKPPDERLTSTEIRALAEVDPKHLVTRAGVARETERDLRVQILKEPSILEPGLEIEDEDPSVPDNESASVPDFVAKDDDGNIVLIEVKRISDLDEFESSVQNLERLVKEYGGKDRARAILATPNSPPDDEEVHPAANVSIQEIDSKSIS